MINECIRGHRAKRPITYDYNLNVDMNEIHKVLEKYIRDRATFDDVYVVTRDSIYEQIKDEYNKYNKNKLQYITEINLEGD